MVLKQLQYMLNKVVLKYFLDLTLFNLPFSLILGFIGGLFWGIISFASFGFLISLLLFNFFKKNQYYAYYNLGYTKLHLAKKVWFLNVCIVVLFFTIHFIIK